MTFIYITLPVGGSGQLSADKEYSVSIENGYHVITDARQRLIARLQKRDEYPGTFCKVLADGEISFGYGRDRTAIDDDFLHITLKQNGELIIQRDVLCTLPLFYGEDGKNFIISNEYEEVWNGLNDHGSFDESAFVEALVPAGLRLGTASSRIKVLHELETLVFKNDEIQIFPGMARPWTISREAPKTNPHDFMSVVETRAEHLIQKFINTPNLLAFEVSGGLDSSFLPLYLTERHPGIVKVLTSMHFPGVFRATQEDKLQKLQEITSAKRIHIDLQSPAYYPLADILKEPKPFYIQRGLYETAIEVYAQLLADQGYRVLFTGDGGDELFDNSIDIGTELAFGVSEVKRRHAVELPSFFTEHFRKVYVEVTPAGAPQLLPQLALNLHGAAISRNNALIRHNIWPVSPFADRELFFFCQGLPAHFRANKNIFRAYYQIKKWPEIIYRPSINEDFGEFFDNAFLSGAYDEVIERLCRNGRAIKSRYINPEELQKTMRDCVAGRITGDVRNQIFFFVYMWLVVELNAAYFSATA